MGVGANLFSSNPEPITDANGGLGRRIFSYDRTYRMGTAAEFGRQAMRLMVVLVVFILPGALAAAALANAEPKLICESQAPGGDTRDIQCPLTASGTPQRFAFKTNFSGGHDDTSASMIATLDGSPLACDEGSKISLFGEDGDISLECKFGVRASAGTRLVLRVTVSWRHAQYSDFEFHPE